ncbi:MAG: signal recognition particle-docking protein FtsY [Bacteroidales bacterium]|nr:signal recognition particle-docking protein FtsY [Candidatus Cryptobacteroides aphodequi]
MGSSFFQKLSKAIAGRTRVSDDLLDSIEEALIESDMGVDTTLKVIDALEDRVERDKYLNEDEVIVMLREEIAALLDIPEPEKKASGMQVILVVGVNGVGKTTTIGKLASRFRSEGKKVLLGAADTFRAAAVDQLCIWAERAGVDIVKQQMGSDPAAVAFDTVKAAIARQADVVLIDTAGRLHNRVDLMNELTKIKGSIAKADASLKPEVLLVLDASTGQNAFQQAREFARATDITALALTKMDGTAKGGVAVGLVDEFRIPIRYIGVGEGIGDLKDFDKTEFIETLFTI